MAGLRAEGKVWESKRERRQWTSGLSGRRVEKGAIGRRALASFATNSEGKDGKETNLELAYLWSRCRVFNCYKNNSTDRQIGHRRSVNASEGPFEAPSRWLLAQ